MASSRSPEGEVPDLRLMPKAIFDQFDQVVLDGALAGNGMASFKDVLSNNDTAAIKAYILDQSHAAWDAGHAKK